MALIVRSEFPDPPSQAVILDFRRHVRETGCPETWNSISTEHPPSDGEVLMLVQGININVKLRPDGAMAPCPICLRDKPKWKFDGSLIWCRATAALYCIGPDCSRGELKRKLAVARNVLAQTAKEQREIDRLAELARLSQELLAWMDVSRQLAESSTARHRQFASSLPKFRSLLSRQLKQSLPAGVAGKEDPGALYRGKAFLTGGWNLGRDFDNAGETLRALQRDSGSDADAWAASLADTPRQARLVDAEAALKLLQRAHERTAATAAFFSPAAFGALSALSRHPDSLAEFSITRTGASATIHHREEIWRGSTGSSAPPPFPAE